MWNPRQGICEMAVNRHTLILVLFSTVNLSLVMANIACFGISDLLSRALLLSTFGLLVVSAIYSGLSNSTLGPKLSYITFVFSSLFFLTWRSLFFASASIENDLNSEAIALSRQYANNGHLTFDSTHSYFFLQPLTLHFLRSIGSFPDEVSIFLSIAIFGVLVTLVGFVFFKAIRRYVVDAGQKGIVRVIPQLGTLMLISFAYSERSGRSTDLSMLLTLLALCLLFSRRLRTRSENVVFALLILGITLGNTDGILLMTSFFLLFSFSGEKRTAVVYALIPLAYLFLSAHSYTLSLGVYARSAIAGFIEFLQSVIAGGLPSRVMPWQRSSSLARMDTYLSSIAYLSLLTFACVVAISLVLLFLRDRKRPSAVRRDNFESPSMMWLFLWLGIAMVTYVGASMRPETSSSDIRTIVIVLLSLVLPFMLISTRFVSVVGRRRVLFICLILLMAVASVRTVYEVTPKSTEDSISVIEDDRLGLSSVYSAGDFINAYYVTGGIVGDYKVLVHIYKYLPKQQYETRLMNQTTINDPFEHFAHRSILAFSLEGIAYPSIYHAPEDYLAAYNFSKSNNRFYDNGVVIIASR
jgi:hypothetical protein